MAVSGEKLRDAIDGASIETTSSGAWAVKAVAEAPSSSNTLRVLSLTMNGPVTFSLRLEIAGEALLGKRPEQLRSWLVQNVQRFLAFNPQIEEGSKLTFVITEP